jgi:hypothetical protein
LLWDDVARERTITWGIALALVATITISTLPPEGSGVVRAVGRHLWNLGSAVLWAVLPWLEPSALHSGEVAWIMAFVVVYGVATDIVFVPQTVEIRLFNIIYGYSASYLLALAFHGQWGAAFAVFGMILALVHGGAVWQRTAALLTAQRDANHARAMMDELTGLASCDAATNRVVELLATSAPGVVVHCVFADLDDFKQLNDTYGYEFGD